MKSQTPKTKHQRNPTDQTATLGGGKDCKAPQRCRTPGRWRGVVNALGIRMVFGAFFASLLADGAEILRSEAGRAIEWTLVSTNHHKDAFNELDLDVIVEGAGRELRIPAFWAGSNIWRARFAPVRPGTYLLRTVCSETGDRSLHNIRTNLTVTPYTGTNRSYIHGAIKV